MDDHVAYGGFGHASDRRHLLLPALHAVQSAIGWVSHGAINYIAERLPVSPAEAFGVADFYDLIATSQRPARVAWVCDDIACKARGVDATLDSLAARLGPAGEAHGDVMWRRSPCLGQCEKGSAAFVQIAGGTDVSLAPASTETIIEILRAEVPRSVVEPTEPTLGTALLSRRSGSIHDHIVGEGFVGLRTALRIGSQAVIDEIEASGLRGRGGASFPAALKWRAVAESGEPRYVVCNADESEPGTFKDRVLMEADPFGLIEALTIAAFAVGATQRIHLHPWRVSDRPSAPRRSHRRDPSCRLPRRGHSWVRVLLRHRAAKRRWCVHLRGGDGPLQLDRGVPG